LLEDAAFARERSARPHSEKFHIEERECIAVRARTPREIRIGKVAPPEIGSGVPRSATGRGRRHGKTGMVKAVEIDEEEHALAEIDKHIPAG
jgi:hypothetical protein